MYEVKLMSLVAKLTTDLVKDKLFTIEVKPPQGDILTGIVLALSIASQDHSSGASLSSGG